MSSRVLRALRATNIKHNVGNLNNWNKKLVNLGAKVVLRDGETELDNFILVELGFNDKGERICKSLGATTDKGYLLASVEDYLEEYETISDFFNEEGELGRIVVQEVNNRIEVSNFAKDDSTKAIKNGQVAHYDATTKKFIISNGDANNAEYDTAGNKYVVVDANAGSLDGQELVRLEIVA